MLTRLADLAVHRWKLVLVLVLLLVATCAALGAGVRDQLSVGGFTDPGTEAARTDRLLEEEFAAGPANHVLIVTMKDGWIDDPENVAAGLDLTAAVAAEPGVADVVSYWSLGSVLPARSPLRDDTATRAILAMRLLGDDDEQRATARRLSTYTGDTPRFTVAATGVVEISREAAEIAEKDLARAELLAAPLTLLALIVVFRGVRAGLLPLAVAATTVLVTFAALSLMAHVVDVSVFGVNLTTALGLGLAIDYSLLVVARYREELGAGRPPDRALRRTLQTAGRTIAFSAAAVAASLVALLVFPVVYLRSFAYAGVTVVVAAALAALIVLPALLAWMGPRIGGADTSSPRATSSFWGRQGERVLRHPALWALGSGLFLLVLAAPFLGLRPGRIDDRVLPEDAAARQATETIREHFSLKEANPIAVYVPDADADDIDTIRAYQGTVLAIPGVDRVDSTQGFARLDGHVAARDFNRRFAGDDGTWFSIISWYDIDDDRMDELITTLRATTGPYDKVLVAGSAATVMDTVDSVVGRLPLALLIIAVTTFIVMFALTGSVVVPLKAVVLNLLSLTATFGALVWVFQDGHLADWLGFTPTGRIDVFTPILMFCVAFGLSMDYEVFVLARMKEEYDLSGSNRVAIVRGLHRTGGLLTAAAIILTIVFVAIATSGVAVVKMFGIGLALAVLIDAFVVRATLTPALMALAGRFNWWAPRPLRRLHLRWGFWENEPVEVPS